MPASEAQRYCSQCDRQVHDLASLTRYAIEELAHRAGGHLCARVTRRPDGSVVTADIPGLPYAASALVTLALATVSSAQNRPALPGMASITGVVLMPTTQTIIQSAEVVFVQDGVAKFTTTTGPSGDWEASLPPGRYDIIFRSGALFGQRVNSVDLHPGEQAFSPVQEVFRYGHLGVTEGTSESVTVGALVGVITGMSFHYAVRHPLGYLNLWKRRIAHALSS